jgi:hypothetical protein
MATAHLGQANLLLRDRDVASARYRPHWTVAATGYAFHISLRARLFQ